MRFGSPRRRTELCGDVITMKRWELERYQIILRTLKKEITQAKAAELLELSERHKPPEPEVKK